MFLYKVESFVSRDPNYVVADSMVSAISKWKDFLLENKKSSFVREVMLEPHNVECLGPVIE